MTEITGLVGCIAFGSAPLALHEKVLAAGGPTVGRDAEDHPYGQS